jgi:hypothetical protein
MFLYAWRRGKIRVLSYPLDFGIGGGFRSLEETPEFLDVGCESRHGPGRGRPIELREGEGAGPK